MPGDYSRRSLNPTRKYSAVLALQGRLLLDSDWNEQVGLQEHRTRVETRDVIGECGTPKNRNGFLLSQTPSGSDIFIGPGHFYVSGLLCELDPEKVLTSFPQATTNKIVVPNLFLDERLIAVGQWVQVSAGQSLTPITAQITSLDAPSLTLTLDANVASLQTADRVWVSRAITYATQPFFPVPDFTVASPSNSPNAVHLDDGDYLAFLKARKKEVGALEDAHIREVALGGPDTCFREQVIWQVGLKLISALSSPPSTLPDCDADFPDWDKDIAAMTGQMNARSVPPPPDQNPCALPPTAGYQNLDNQLYRVEVFQGNSTRELSTFVWSRDNAMVETNITNVDDLVLTVSNLGKDDLHSFDVNQWVEIIDPEGDLQGSPRFLAQITDPPDTSTSTIKLSVTASSYAGRTGLRLRRWDMTGPSVTTQGIPMQAGFVDLEYGVQVSFTEGSYESHAYWQVPARTATGDVEWPPFQVPNENPIPQSPLGDYSHYCRLAIIEVRGGIWAIYDCRKQFPPLTHICADDVCYESQCEDFQSAKTVQQALDEMCHERDLRFHNKHLHGWGIVCGLEVVCGPDGPSGPRENVTVNPGYAIDCEGDDVILEKAAVLNIFDMIPSSPPGSVPADGDYSLILNSESEDQFSAVPYVPDTLFQSLFNDSILQDFLNDCVKSLTGVFTGVFTDQPGDSNQIITPAQQRIDTLIDLVSQYTGSDAADYVYISGFQPNSAPPTEDAILRGLYNQLKQKLQSETFCAMFDAARPFPNYPFPNLEISTIYGKGYRTNLRVDPSGSRLYTFGVDENIYVYNLATNQIDSIIQFPTAGAIVQDLAFSSNGSQLYAVAILNVQDTIFAIADVASFVHTWRNPTTIICDILISALAMLSSDANNVYALGRGHGIYQLNIATPVATPLLMGPTFSAFGHLVIDSASGFAYATASSTTGVGTPPPSFDQVLRRNLKAPGTNEATYSLPQLGYPTDDIAVVPASSNLPGGILFVTLPSALGAPQKLLSYNAAAAAPVLLSSADLGETVPTVLRLTYNPVTQMMMICCLESNRIRIVKQDGTSPQILDFALPTEYLPLAITYNPAAEEVFILDYASNTISVVPPDQFAVANQIDLSALLTYRTGVIDAFLDLLAGLLQYMKDCFCDHLLVKCPTCDEDDQINLGTISIRSGQVYKICNFTKRKYVKSFPTVGYWLSLIPILPLLHMFVEKICCMALPERFGAMNAPQPSAAYASHPIVGNSAVKFPAIKIQGAIMAVQHFKPASSLGSAVTKYSFSKTIFGNYLQSQTQPPAPPSANVKTQTLIGQNVQLSKAALEKANVHVDGVVQANPADVRTNLKQFITAPDSLPANSFATLVTDQGGTVVGVIPTSSDVQKLRSDVSTSQQQFTQATAQLQQVAQSNDQLKARADATDQTLASNKTALDGVTGLKDQVTTLQAQLTALQTAHAADIAQRDQQISALKTSVTEAQDQLKVVSDLQGQVKKLSTQIKPPK
jgi:hypothetical protein